VFGITKTNHRLRQQVDPDDAIIRQFRYNNRHNADIFGMYSKDANTHDFAMDSICCSDGICGSRRSKEATERMPPTAPPGLVK
jgi:hypothetical protein